MSSFGGETPVLIQTKLHRPLLGQDLIARPHLIQRLNQGADRKLTLISAQAGSGKSTLLAQWLEQCPQPSAWLALDEDDNNFTVFVSYLCAAIQTSFPDACEAALDLLKAPVTPPPRLITTLLVNELIDLCDSQHSFDEEGGGTGGLIIALDDYHTIKEPTVHELVSELVTYLPQCVHLALSTRTDPPLPLAGLRARKDMTQLRTGDLRLNLEESGKLLELTVGRRLSDDIVNLLMDKTEGWAVGLWLAALSIRDLPDDREFASKLEETNSSIVADYLMSEVLSQQSSLHQEFLLRSSILKRFNAELCDAILWIEENPSSETSLPVIAPSRVILTELRSTNLFLLSLDQEDRWFRYHHLFRDLLRHRLQHQHDPEHVRTLHSLASQWFEENGFTEEALAHAFSSGDLDQAAGIIARQRHGLMNHARWQRLDRYLGLFPEQFVNRQPDLLLLKAWLIYHDWRYDQLPGVLEELEEAIGQTTMPPETVQHLKAEASILASLLSYYTLDVERTIVYAQFAIANTPREAWIARVLARLLLAGAYQMRGEQNQAYHAILGAGEQETTHNKRFTATVLMASCYVYWVAADLNGLLQVADQCLTILENHQAVEIERWVHYHLGCANLYRNNLVEAERHFVAATCQPHLSYGDCYTYSAIGLAMTYLAQRRTESARDTIEAAVSFLLETGNMMLLQVTRAFEAELALREGRLAEASRWAALLEADRPLMAMTYLYQYEFTLIKVWLAQNTWESRQNAAELLGKLRQYTETHHNRLFLINVLALSAVLHDSHGNRPEALAELEHAIELAQPGEIVRPFVDSGPIIAKLLHALQDRAAELDPMTRHVTRVLTAFDEAKNAEPAVGTRHSSEPASILVKLLTPREIEVLELLAQRLTNKEIAEILFISPATVKTHTLNIYAKLDVNGRQQAVDKALEIGLLPPLRS